MEFSDLVSRLDIYKKWVPQRRCTQRRCEARVGRGAGPALRTKDVRVHPTEFIKTIIRKCLLARTMFLLAPLENASYEKIMCPSFH